MKYILNDIIALLMILTRWRKKNEDIEQEIIRKVADVIILDINEGRLKIGDRLPSIKALSESFGVGQATIREALNALRAMGYVEIKHGQGTFIVEREEVYFNIEAINGDVNDIENLLEVRKIVEVGVSRLAAEKERMMTYMLLNLH